MTRTGPTSQSHAAEAGARSVFYRGLALLFQHPDEHWAELVRLGNLFPAMHEAASSLGQPAWRDALERIETQLAAHLSSPLELSVEYVRLFGLHGEIHCPPFAAEFGDRHTFAKAQQLADINGFYAAFRLDLPPEAAERPDHLSVLFQFLSFLAIKQVHAISERNEQGLAVTRDAEKKFFRQFVANWVPVFCEALGRQTRQAYYRELAALTKQLVERDETRLGVRVERATLSRRKSDPGHPTCVACPQS